MSNNVEQNLNCPICLTIFVMPRIYSCGHSVCEECMYKCDKENEEATVSNFDSPVYKCPLCRVESVVPYTERPLNRSLMTILETTKDYSKISKYRKSNFMKKIEINLYDGINLSHLAFKSKFTKCEKHYKEIMPLIYKAAKEGKSKLTILTNTKELQTIYSMLSKKLFSHGIYKVQATPTEFNIYILPERTINYRFEQTNPEFQTTNDTLPTYSTFNLEQEYNNIVQNLRQQPYQRAI